MGKGERWRCIGGHGLRLSLEMPPLGKAGGVRKGYRLIRDAEGRLVGMAMGEGCRGIRSAGAGKTRYAGGLIIIE